MISLAGEGPAAKSPTKTLQGDKIDNDSGSVLSDMVLDIEEDDVISHSGDCEGDKSSTTATDRSPSPEKELTMRLLFPFEDGGALIGKDGRHITKLKESTTATWLITSNNSNYEDRVVILRGSVDSIASLAKHLCEQSKGAATDDNSTDRVLTLYFLFPFKCIGAIVGPAGAYVQKLRTEPGVRKLHIFKNTIPFTQERIVEVGATASGMKLVSAWLLRHTKSNLTLLQESSTLYKPVRDGLRQFLALDQRTGGSDPHELTKSAGSSSTATSFAPHRARPGDEVGSSGGGGRKRSHSALGPDHPGSADGTSRSLSYKRPRGLSEVSSTGNASSRSGHGTRTGRSSDRPRSSYSTTAASSRPRRHSPSSSHRRSDSSRHGSHHGSSKETEEKMVVPDRIAGRLIGRNGMHLLHLQDCSGAQIKLSPRIENMPDRIVTIVGRPDRVTNACRLIKDSVRTFEDLDK
ncbi:hypothetical protein GGI12_000574 [Dipsacomyces acuminosporus]|nr:hypothetical protein GGI12_000574 [Dipsacomyces acuminosporus]